MEITKIKYFKASCYDCHIEYTVNLGLYTRELHCYKCGNSLRFPELDMKRIEALNKALKEFTNDFKLMTDTDGLVVSKEDHIYEVLT